MFLIRALHDRERVGIVFAEAISEQKFSRLCFRHEFLHLKERIYASSHSQLFSTDYSLQRPDLCLQRPVYCIL